jgi:pimeloyl-ACP methyl ester carboxylesterase
VTVLHEAPVLGGRVAGVSFAVVGHGSPTTVFAHGLGGSATETRTLAARTPGTRVLLTFRGHGDSDALPAGWDYDLLADDLLAIADATGADHAVGLSVGSGALLRALSREPARFARLGFVLPAALDAARPDGATLRLRALGDAIDRRDIDGVAALLLDEVPAQTRNRRGVHALVTRRAAQLVTRPAPRPVGDDRPLRSRRALAAVTAPALVVAQADDPLHSLDVARDLSAALPQSSLLTLPPGGVFWTASRQAQDAVARHLSEEDA